VPVRISSGRVQAGEARFDAEALDLPDGKAVAYVRPEHLALSTTPLDGGWKATLRHVYLAGSVAHLELDVPSLGQTLEVEIGGEDAQRRGFVAGLAVTVQPRHLTVFGIDTGSGNPDPARRRVLHPRYSQAALARVR
jgi:sulfate transport system ATP-binding protein